VALSFKWGDFIILVTLFLLFAELVKATYTSTSSLVDHGLSMFIFIPAWSVSAAAGGDVGVLPRHGATAIDVVAASPSASASRDLNGQQLGP
jgi:hypothetical protein